MYRLVVTPEGLEYITMIFKRNGWEPEERAMIELITFVNDNIITFEKGRSDHAYEALCEVWRWSIGEDIKPPRKRIFNTALRKKYLKIVKNGNNIYNTNKISSATWV